MDDIHTKPTRRMPRYEDADVRDWGAVFWMSAAVLVCTAVLALFLAMLGGCASVRPLGGRSETTQDVNAVRILVACPGIVKGGSGVIVSATRVLTSLHVVACDDSFPVILVETPQGNRPAVVAQQWVHEDTAALVLGGTPIGYGPIVTTSPIVGAVVCAARAVPERGRLCGVVEKDWGRAVDFVGAAVQGNSGSGVYDASGRLVGLVSGIVEHRATRVTRIPSGAL